MAKEQEDWKGLFSEAVSLYMQGVDGDKQAVKEAYALMEKVRKISSNNNLVDAYYGGARTLAARDTVDPMEKLKKATSGLKIIDNAVAKDPDNTEIRILRAYVCTRIPEEFFHRSSIAINDFNYLLSRYETSRGIFSQRMYWEILYELGMAYKNAGKRSEAEKTWQSLLSQTTDTNYRKLLRREGLTTS